MCQEIDILRKDTEARERSEMSSTDKERAKFLFNNDKLGDIKFVVLLSLDGEISRKTITSAHRFLLAVSGSVFYAMFCGMLAEKSELIHPSH